MKRTTMVVALIVGMAIGSSPATAHREWRGGYGSGPGNVADIAGIPGLNLSAEQSERIGALREAHRSDIKPLQEELMGKGRQLRELWLAKTPDREKILALQREVHNLRGRLLEKLAAYRLGVLQMLTPDQQAKVRAFEAERHMGRMGPAGTGRVVPPAGGRGVHPPRVAPSGKGIRVLCRKRAVRARKGREKPLVLRTGEGMASETKPVPRADIESAPQGWEGREYRQWD